MPFNGEFGQLSYTSLQLYLNHFVCLNERNYLDKIAVEMFIEYFDLVMCRPLLLQFQRRHSARQGTWEKNQGTLSELQNVTTEIEVTGQSVTPQTLRSQNN